jgi:hypothetical protein
LSDRDASGPGLAWAVHTVTHTMSGVSGQARQRALIAVVAALLLGGMAFVSLPGEDHDGAPGSAQPPGPAPGGTLIEPDTARAEAVTALLDVRSEALFRRDEQAFLGTLDPQADPAFLAAQRAMFANLAAVPLRDWSYLVNAANQIDASRFAAAAAADDIWAPEVRLSYAVQGIDEMPTRRQLGYLFVRRGDRWYVRSDQELAAIGRPTWRGPWDYGPCEVIITERGVVLFHPGRRPMAQRLAAELDPAVAAVTATVGPDWPRRVGLLLPDSQEEMRELVGPGFPVDSVVAVSVADRVDTALRLSEGQRVVLSPDAAEKLSAPALRIVLRHEMTHIATRSYTVDGSPMWLLEGFADYVGHRDSGIPLGRAAPELASLMLTSGPPGTLPADEDFRATGDDLALAYQRSYSLALFVADRLGEPRLVQLYRRLAGEGRAGGDRIDAALREVIGLDREELLSAWQEYLREKFY